MRILDPPFRCPRFADKRCLTHPESSLIHALTKGCCVLRTRLVSPARFLTMDVSTIPTKTRFDSATPEKNRLMSFSIRNGLPLELIRKPILKWSQINYGIWT